jgi:hypothetical protein
MLSALSEPEQFEFDAADIAEVLAVPLQQSPAGRMSAALRVLQASAVGRHLHAELSAPSDHGLSLHALASLLVTVDPPPYPEAYSTARYLIEQAKGGLQLFNGLSVLAEQAGCGWDWEVCADDLISCHHAVDELLATGGSDRLPRDPEGLDWCLRICLIRAKEGQVPKGRAKAAVQQIRNLAERDRAEPRLKPKVTIASRVLSRRRPRTAAAKFCATIQGLSAEFRHTSPEKHAAELPAQASPGQVARCRRNRPSLARPGELFGGRPKPLAGASLADELQATAGHVLQATAGHVLNLAQYESYHMEQGDVAKLLSLAVTEVGDMTHHGDCWRPVVHLIARSPIAAKQYELLVRSGGDGRPSLLELARFLACFGVDHLAVRQALLWLMAESPTARTFYDMFAIIAKWAGLPSTDWFGAAPDLLKHCDTVSFLVQNPEWEDPFDVLDPTGQRTGIGPITIWLRFCEDRLRMPGQGGVEQTRTALEKLLNFAHVQCDLPDPVSGKEGLRNWIATQPNTYAAITLLEAIGSALSALVGNTK